MGLAFTLLLHSMVVVVVVVVVVVEIVIVFSMSNFTAEKCVFSL